MDSQNPSKLLDFISLLGFQFEGVSSELVRVIPLFLRHCSLHKSIVGENLMGADEQNQEGMFRQIHDRDLSFGLLKGRSGEW
jgi:hypothetical protein